MRVDEVKYYTLISWAYYFLLFCFCLAFVSNRTSRPSLLQQLQSSGRRGGGAARSTSKTSVGPGIAVIAAIAPTAKEKEHKRFQPNNARKTRVLSIKRKCAAAAMWSKSAPTCDGGDEVWDNA